MQDGWVVFLLLLGLLIFGGTLFFFWLARVAAGQREEEALTATDLRALEESVQALIGRLKSASDEAVAEIDARQARLQALLDRADALLPSLSPPSAPEDAVRNAGDGLGALDVCRLAEDGLDGAEIARRAGLSRGEVELILELQASRR